VPSGGTRVLAHLPLPRSEAEGECAVQGQNISNGKRNNGSEEHR
jgi:hypothetical protein